MEVLDRMGNKVNVGDKIAWVATSYGSAYLKIGTIVSIDCEEIGSREAEDYDYVAHKAFKTGKTIRIYSVAIKANIANPSDVSKRYVARLPELTYMYDGENYSLKIDRMEKV